MYIKKQLISFALLICVTLFSISAFCKNIDLYEQPTTNAKVVGSIDLSAGIIPIFTPKDNTAWIKVADPRNGNVGWIKNSDLSGNDGAAVTFKQQISSGNNPPQSYQLTVGDPKNLPTEQPPADMMQMLKQQQQKLLKAAQEMINNVNQINQRQGNNANNAPVPMLMPIVVVPVEKAPASAAPTAPTPQQK